METGRWAALLPELVDRVAGRLLDDADVDCYMALRAVCRNWRAATADPRSTLDPRFRPRGWVMLNYPSHGVDARLLVNTATGRFHGRSMPMLRRYYVVSVTGDGLLVLAARDPPHAACVLNPFTGHMVRFAARMRPGVLAAAVSGSSPPYLVLYCRDTMKLYRASPDCKEFVRYKKKYAYPLVRKAVQGCVAVDGHEGVLLPPLPAAALAKIADLMSPVAVLDIPANTPDDEIELGAWKRCFVVESAGETLVVFKLENRVEVFKLDMGANSLEHIKSIGNRAIFIGGCHRCLSLDAGKFPSIEANCVYFTDRLGSLSTDMYHLNDGEQTQSVVNDPNGADPSVNLNLPAFLCSPLMAHPFTIIQLLAIYTFNMQSAQVTQVVEHEDRILEKLRTGEMSFADLLRSCQAGSDDANDDSA